MFTKLIDALKATRRTIVFTEGPDARILEAADRLIKDDLMNVILIGNVDEVKAAAEKGGFDIAKAEIIDPATYAGMDGMVAKMVELRKGKMSEEDCRKALAKGNYFGTMLVKMGKADALLGGATYSTADTVRPALQLVKTKKGAHLVSSSFILFRKDKDGNDEKYCMGDCAINIDYQDTVDKATGEPVTDVSGMPVEAKAALLMEKETGQVLFAQNEHEKLEPASVTKIMTLLLVMEAMDRGELKYEDMVTVSANAASMGGSQVYLSEGEQISVEELLKAVCVSSGNDAAVALAEQVAGVTELFVQQMNNRAMELGMGDTHFVNPTGLPAEGHVTSAWDIALMSRELVLHHPDIRRFTTIWMDTIRGGEFGLSNTNKLIRFYDGATGLKTGSTDAAGYCISATAEREGMELIAVVLGSETSQQRFEDAKTMLNYGFSTYVLADVTPEETPVAPVRLGRTPSVEASLAQSKLLVGKGQAGGLTRTVKLQEDLSAPVEKGQAVGTLTVQSGDTTLAELPLTAAAAVERMTWGDLFTRLLRAAVFG